MVWVNSITHQIRSVCCTCVYLLYVYNYIRFVIKTFGMYKMLTLGFVADVFCMGMLENTSFYLKLTKND